MKSFLVLYSSQKTWVSIGWAICPPREIGQIINVNLVDFNNVPYPAFTHFTFQVILHFFNLILQRTPWGFSRELSTLCFFGVSSSSLSPCYLYVCKQYFGDAVLYGTFGPLYLFVLFLASAMPFGVVLELLFSAFSMWWWNVPLSWRLVMCVALVITLFQDVLKICFFWLTL